MVVLWAVAVGVVVVVVVIVFDLFVTFCFIVVVLFVVLFVVPQVHSSKCRFGKYGRIDGGQRRPGHQNCAKKWVEFIVHHQQFTVGRSQCQTSAC